MEDEELGEYPRKFDYEEFLRNQKHEHEAGPNMLFSVFVSLPFALAFWLLLMYAIRVWLA